MKPLVGIIMGSKSDWDTLQSAADTLQRLGVAFETRVVSAHRTPDLLFEYASTARARGLEVIIAGAGGAAHLPGMLALAGYPPGLRFVFLDQSPDAPGAQVGRIITGAFDDRSRLAALAREVDVITFDVENVPVEAVAEIAATKPFLPPVAALGASQ